MTRWPAVLPRGGGGRAGLPVPPDPSRRGQSGDRLAAALGAPDGALEPSSWVPRPSSTEVRAADLATVGDGLGAVARLGKLLHQSCHVGDGPMLRNLAVREPIYTNGRKGYVPFRRLVDGRREHLRHDAVLLGNLLLDGDLEMLEGCEAAGEALMIPTKSIQPAFVRRWVCVVDAVECPELWERRDLAPTPNDLNEVLNGFLVGLCVRHLAPRPRPPWSYCALRLRLAPTRKGNQQKEKCDGAEADERQPGTRPAERQKAGDQKRRGGQDRDKNRLRHPRQDSPSHTRPPPGRHSQPAATKSPRATWIVQPAVSKRS